jgi:hypothetical protein
MNNKLEKLLHELVCSYCSKEFKASRRDALYCSNICKTYKGRYESPEGKTNFMKNRSLRKQLKLEGIINEVTLKAISEIQDKVNELIEIVSELSKKVEQNSNTIRNPKK